MSTGTPVPVLEPRADELSGFATSAERQFHQLHAIFIWAGFTWGVKYVHSPGGALLTNLGSEFLLRSGDDPAEPKVPTMKVDEFASIPIDELERHIEEANGKFSISADPVILQKETLESSDYTKAKAVHRGKARKAHRAAYLVCS